MTLTFFDTRILNQTVEQTSDVNVDSLGCSELPTVLLLLLSSSFLINKSHGNVNRVTWETYLGETMELAGAPSTETRLPGPAGILLTDTSAKAG